MAKIFLFVSPRNRSGWKFYFQMNFLKSPIFRGNSMGHIINFLRPNDVLSWKTNELRDIKNCTASKCGVIVIYWTRRTSWNRSYFNKKLTWAEAFPSSGGKWRLLATTEDHKKMNGGLERVSQVFCGKFRYWKLAILGLRGAAASAYVRWYFVIYLLLKFICEWSESKEKIQIEFEFEFDFRVGFLVVFSTAWTFFGWFDRFQIVWPGRVGGGH